MASNGSLSLTTSTGDYAAGGGETNATLSTEISRMPEAGANNYENLFGPPASIEDAPDPLAGTMPTGARDSSYPVTQTLGPGNRSVPAIADSIN